MATPQLLATLLTGLFMGWLMGVIWQSSLINRVVQVAVGAAGALLAYVIFLASFEFPLGWLGALTLAAVGAMVMSLAVNVGAILVGGGPLALPREATDAD